VSRGTYRVAAGLILLFALFASARAEAQPPSVVVLVCDDADRLRIDLARIGARVEAETGTDVALDGLEHPDGAALHIRIESDAQVVLVLVQTDGTTMERATELPPDPVERAETLAILAVNMLRDESAELLALLRPPPVVVEAPAPVVDAIMVAAPSVEPTAPLEAEPPPEPRDPFLRFGLAAHVGSISSSDGLEPDVLGGGEVAWTPTPFLAIGARDLTVGGTLYGSGVHVDAAPFAELGLVLSFVTLYADLGAHVQLQTGSGNGGPTSFGVAPLLVAGIRFRLAPEVSLGAETAVRVVATDSFFTGLHELPQLAVPWTGGLSLLFHVS
jgi:hypothetical protein